MAYENLGFLRMIAEISGDLAAPAIFSLAHIELTKEPPDSGLLAQCRWHDLQLDFGSWMVLEYPSFLEGDDNFPRYSIIYTKELETRYYLVSSALLIRVHPSGERTECGRPLQVSLQELIEWVVSTHT